KIHPCHFITPSSQALSPSGQIVVKLSLNHHKISTLPRYLRICSALISSPRSRFPLTQIGGSTPRSARFWMTCPTMPTSSVIATTVEVEQNFSLTRSSSSTLSPFTPQISSTISLTSLSSLPLECREVTCVE